MNVSYKTSFTRDLKRIKEKRVKQQIKAAIEEVKEADRLGDISNMLKMKGHDTYYRIWVGDYRVGLHVADDEVVFVRCLHRKDIYRAFP